MAGVLGLSLLLSLALAMAQTKTLSTGGLDSVSYFDGRAALYHRVHERRHCPV